MAVLSKEEGTRVNQVFEAEHGLKVLQAELEEVERQILLPESWRRRRAAILERSRHFNAVLVEAGRQPIPLKTQLNE